MSWGSAIFEIRQQPTYSGSGQICVIFLTMFGYLSCRHYEMTSHTRSVQVSMWPDICNIFSHFHCWLVVPPPSWSSCALCTVLLCTVQVCTLCCALCSCAPCHPLLVHCWWDPRAQNVTNNFVTTFLLLRALCTFCQRNLRKRWKSSSFEQKICPYRRYKSSSYSKCIFRLPKQTNRKATFFNICPKQTNK